jgi:hypothetical protein
LSTSIITDQGSKNLQEVLNILNGRDKTQKQSVTKSFRVDQDVIRKIELEAKNNNTSINAEVNSILTKYVKWDLIRSSLLFMGCPSFRIYLFQIRILINPLTKTIR